MLNNNSGVHLLAEPLSSLAGPKNKDPVLEVSARKEFALLTSSLDKVIHESGQGLSLIGFNEKFVSPKFALPGNENVLGEFASYLRDKHFR